MPTSAAASAGASLMPSPTIATTPCARRSSLHHIRLVLRQDLGADFVGCPRARRSPRRPPRLSPVSITVAMPRRASSATASAASGLSSSPMASNASTRGAAGQLCEPGHGLSLLLERPRAAVPGSPCLRPAPASSGSTRSPAAVRRSVPRSPARRRLRGPFGSAARLRASLSRRRSPPARADARCRTARRPQAPAPSARSPSTATSATSDGLAHRQRAGLVEGDHASPRARSRAPRRP